MFNSHNKMAKKNSLEQRESQRNRFIDGLVVGQVISSSSSTEELTVSKIPTKVTVQHPFCSISSWDRAQPEAGSLINVEFNKESNTPIMIGYRNYDPEKLVSAYNEGNSLYRELAEGELERMSKGMAYTFHTDRPLQQVRAGICEETYDGEKGISFKKSTLFLSQLHLHVSARLEDECRLGVVRRYKTALTTKLIEAPKGETGFSKESTLVLLSSDGKLLDYREGHVVNDDGTHAMSSQTGNFLRVRKKVFTKNENYLLEEIDNKANVLIKFPTDATKGLNLDISNGSLQVSIGKDASIISTDQMLIKADGKSTATFGGYLTKLGIDAKHPLVFGDDFVKYLLQFLIEASVHTHPGTTPSPNMATACTNLASVLPNVVSRNVTCE